MKWHLPLLLSLGTSLFVHTALLVGPRRRMPEIELVPVQMAWRAAHKGSHRLVSSVVQKTVPLLAGAAPGGAAAGADDGSATPEFLSQLRARIEAQKLYPRESVRRHEMGQVEVEFVIEASGELTDVRVANPCEYPLLNEAARSAVQRVGRLQQVPESLLAQTVVLPILFRLD